MREETVYVGVLQLRLEMPWVQSLKEKRALVAPVVAKVKTRFDVAAARLQGSEKHHSEVIGVSAISNDAVGLEALLCRVEAFVAAHGDYQISRRQLDIERWESLD